MLERIKCLVTKVFSQVLTQLHACDNVITVSIWISANIEHLSKHVIRQLQIQIINISLLKAHRYDSTKIGIDLTLT